MIDVKALRQKLGLTQEQFAVKLGTTAITIRRWEKGYTKPNGMAQRLLEEVSRESEPVVGLDPRD